MGDYEPAAVQLLAPCLWYCSHAARDLDTAGLTKGEINGESRRKARITPVAFAWRTSPEHRQSHWQSQNQKPVARREIHPEPPSPMPSHQRSHPVQTYHHWANTNWFTKSLLFDLQAKKKAKLLAKK